MKATFCLLLFLAVPRASGAAQEPWRTTENVAAIPREELDSITARGLILAWYWDAVYHADKAIQPLQPRAELVNSHVARKAERRTMGGRLWALGRKQVCIPHRFSYYPDERGLDACSDAAAGPSSLRRSVPWPRSAPALRAGCCCPTWRRTPSVWLPCSHRCPAPQSPWRAAPADPASTHLCARIRATGHLELFLVPIRPEAGVMRYEAVFG